MNKKPFMILTDESFTIFWNGELSTCTSDVANWKEVMTAYREERWDDLVDLIDQTRAIAAYTADADGVEVRDGAIFWQGEEMHGALVNRILAMKAEGFDIDPMVKFMANLMENPSARAREQLYGFLAANTLPITPDGCFMAYKKITSEWKDCYTRTIDNSIGKVVEMERRNVDDDPNRTCSRGLHVCSLEYLRHFGGQRLVGVKVNPADVVSVPVDYNNSKMRCAKYEVIEELPMSMCNDDAEDYWNQSVVGDVDNDHVIEHPDTDALWRSINGEWTDDLNYVMYFESYNDAEFYLNDKGLEGDVVPARTMR